MGKIYLNNIEDMDNYHGAEVHQLNTTAHKFINAAALGLMDIR